MKIMRYLMMISSAATSTRGGRSISRDAQFAAFHLVSLAPPIGHNGSTNDSQKIIQGALTELFNKTDIPGFIFVV